MATIGSLAVNIIATTDKFIAGLNAANTRLGKFVKSIATVNSAVVGLGVYGFASVVKGAVDAGGALFDLSQKLRISTEALGALDYAIEQLGGNTQSLHNSLAIMSRTLGNAEQGSKSAIVAFQRLGLESSKLIQLPVEQQFLMIVDAINKIPNAAGQAAAAQAIFGRGAKELAALTSAGTDEIVRFGDEAARSGAIISTEQAAALDEAGDAIAAFSRQWGAMTQQLVATFAPAISMAMKGITETIKFLHTVWNAFQVAILGGLAGIEGALYGVTKAINFVLPKFLEFEGLEQDFRVGMEEFARQARDIGRQVDKRYGGSQSGPLSIKKMDELISATKSSGVKLTVAGVR